MPFTPFGPSIGNTAPPLPIASGGTGATTAAGGLANLGGLVNQATTGPAGFALQNATPNILTWAVPNDGAMHTVMMVSMMSVASLETGGQVTLSFTGPDSAVHSRTVYAANLAAGFQAPAAQLWPVQAGTTVTLAQASALTAGASTVWAILWGV